MVYASMETVPLWLDFSCLIEHPLRTWYRECIKKIYFEKMENGLTSRHYVLIENARVYCSSDCTECRCHKPLCGIKSKIPLGDCWTSRFNVIKDVILWRLVCFMSTWEHYVKVDADGRWGRHGSEQGIALPVTDKPTESSVRRRMLMLRERLNPSRKSAPATIKMWQKDRRRPRLSLSMR